MGEGQGEGVICSAPLSSFPPRGGKELTSPQGLLNKRDNTIKIRGNFIIPEPYYTKTLRFQPLCSYVIVSLVLFNAMLPAINFNYQLLLKTNEINDVDSDRLLSTEFNSI